MPGSQSTLLLEDDDLDAAVTRELMENCGAGEFSVEHVKVLKDAVRLVSRKDYGVALLDMNLADSSGLDTIRQMVAANPQVPIVVLSGDDNLDTAIEALRAGAQDYLPKSQLDSQTLQRVVAYAIQRKEVGAGSGGLSREDTLTGLANRRGLHERWKRSLSRAKRNGMNVGVITAAIGSFGELNMRHGHPAANEALKQLANTLLLRARETDIVARLGGNEFVLVMENVHKRSDVEEMQRRLIAATLDSVRIEGQEISYSVEFGAALIDPNSEQDLLSAMSQADDDMITRASLVAGHA